ncbi:hypothetical protein EON65_38640 [archaeon]|nr:MAG: hypothetical protein EON65_38640 [archaeon]
MRRLETPTASSSVFSSEYWQFLWDFDNMVTASPRPPPFGVTTITMILFFVTNFILYLYFLQIKTAQKSTEVIATNTDVEKKDKKEKEHKELSKPFQGTIDCYYNLTSELTRTGLIMAMTYVAEYLWIFPHSSKSYSRDLFLFVLILFFAYALYTIKPVNDLSLLGNEGRNMNTHYLQIVWCLCVWYSCCFECMDYFLYKRHTYAHTLLAYSLTYLTYTYTHTCIHIHETPSLHLTGREQTEEWKGWMQFIFLLYHYFHAEEVYNSVRVMITCYVWMTGFGNFSFFYIKQDFSWLRVAQMMWRLNFSVLLLMWTHSNTYILYYICPMHTFYFLMVYVTMYIYYQHNTSKWGIRVKLMVLAAVIYVIWDINGGLFDLVFAWLGTEKVRVWYVYDVW